MVRFVEALTKIRRSENFENKYAENEIRKRVIVFVGAMNETRGTTRSIQNR